MPRGISAKREREYEKLVDNFKDEGRYKGREEEVAARIVNKQRAEQGETIAAKVEDKAGKSPDRNLPIENYDRLTVPQVTGHLDGMKRKQIKKIRRYEEKHRHRKTLLEQIERHLHQ